MEEEATNLKIIFEVEETLCDQISNAKTTRGEILDLKTREVSPNGSTINRYWHPGNRDYQMLYTFKFNEKKLFLKAKKKKEANIQVL